MSSATPEYSVGKTIMLILGLSFIQFVIPLVFNFMDIDAKYYQVYIYWTMALVIFYISLPSVVGEYIFLLPMAKQAVDTTVQPPIAPPAKKKGANASPKNKGSVKPNN